MFKHKKITALIIVVFICVAGSVVVVDFFRYATMPGGNSRKKNVFIVKTGQGTNTVTAELFKQGFITHPLKFKILARIKGLSKQIKAGEYLFSYSMTPTDIIEKMIKGNVRLIKITIPEGSTIRQISSAVGQAGIVSESVFYRYATDPALTGNMHISAPSFEGYLFPDTYYFSRGVSPKTIISTMVDRFRSIFKPEWEKRAKELGFTVHEIVTLASIIEKETGTPSERPIISSVFHNRLKKRMRLESDPTVIYGITDFNGNLTRADLRRRTPYNTYRKKGLPIGPIANPGREALNAALYPENTEYLYFVSKRDATHQFSKNIREHNLAVRRYQILRR